VLDALVLSDLHLGTDVCQAKMLVHFLEGIHRGERLTRRLILNGDVFDSIDFRRLKKQHWKVLSLIRKLSDQIEIVWINGNHDGPAEFISPLLGVTVVDEYELDTGSHRMLLLHGHRFDDFLDRYPITTQLADWGYRLLQRIDKSHGIARYAKQSSKTFLRCALKVQDSAMDYAKKRGFDIVSCGHTHLPVAVPDADVQYYNSGSWTERPCHYLTVQNGTVALCSYNEEIPQLVEESEHSNTETASDLAPVGV